MTISTRTSSTAGATAAVTAPCWTSENNKVVRRRRQHQRGSHHTTATSAATVLLSTVLVVLSLSSRSANAFMLASKPLLSSTTLLPNLLRATREDESRTASSTEPDTWSRPNPENSSRFGVRRRVRAVLEKAKNRTGRNNYSNQVADAASIGGLAEVTDLFFSSSSYARGVEDFSYGLNNSTGLVPGSALSSKNGAKQQGSKVSVDSLLVSENTVDPLPFTLPKLTNEQKKLLAAGERVQEQSKMGREGAGFVVVDVNAPPYAVWECLLDFESYPERIGTVRSMRMFTNQHLSSSYFAEKPVLPGTETRHYGKASISRASFLLSKFKLNIAVVHQYQPHPDGHYMVFTLDPACKNMVLQDAKGIWYTESNPDGLGNDVTRVWLLCDLKVASFLPMFIVDYAAKRAMPRATSWLKPAAEEMKKALLGL